MAKRKSKNSTLALDNLHGFARMGAKAETKTFIPTGHFELDFAINYGILPGDKELLGHSYKQYDSNKPLGIPSGRVVEVYGQEGSGKSSICHRIVGQAQKLGHICAWIDAEQSYSEDLAIINGVDMDDLVYSDLTNEEDPDKVFYAEDVMDQIITLIRDNGVKVVVLDSVASLVPKAMMEAPADQQFMALLARLMGQNVKKIGQWASKKDALVIFINQLRDKPGNMFGPSQTTPGGHALKFHASLRMALTKRTSKKTLIMIEDEDGNPKVIGRNSGVQISKNRFAQPLLDSKGNTIILEIPIYYQPYFPGLEDIAFNTGRQFKLIRPYKGNFSWTNVEGKKIEAEGRAAFIKLLSDGLLPDFVIALREKSKETGVPLPPELDQYRGGAVPKKLEVDADGEVTGGVDEL